MHVSRIAHIQCRPAQVGLKLDHLESSTECCVSEMIQYILVLKTSSAISKSLLRTALLKEFLPCTKPQFPKVYMSYWRRLRANVLCSYNTRLHMYEGNTTMNLLTVTNETSSLFIQLNLYNACICRFRTIENIKF